MTITLGPQTVVVDTEAQLLALCSRLGEVGRGQSEGANQLGQRNAALIGAAIRQVCFGGPGPLPERKDVVARHE